MMGREGLNYEAIVIGTSAGGLYSLIDILQHLPSDYRIPIIIVQHRSKDHRELLEEVLQHKCKINIVQAEEKESVLPGQVYIAPPDYHLLIESDKRFSLTSDELVKHSRPSIDVLFESAAVVYKEKLIGIVLTGASSDGAVGIAMFKRYGGITLAQDPAEAAFPYMPKASIETRKVDKVLSLEKIREFLLHLN
jgi:two-component system, chemotaxis family, protein-glutamate methylesterase/glutaminase